MANQKKNLATRTRSLLFPSEPYEMTYWKAKLNSPLHRFLAAIKHWYALAFFHPLKGFETL